MKNSRKTQPPKKDQNKLDFFFFEKTFREKILKTKNDLDKKKFFATVLIITIKPCLPKLKDIIKTV